jgi:nicotinate-nucleotide adenylyltransferase
MARHPEHDFVFIVGADVLAGLPAWEDAAAVVEQASFAAVRRPGQAEVELDPALRVQWFEMSEYAEASSGAVRRALAAGKVPAEVDARVMDYVRKKALYQG